MSVEVDTQGWSFIDQEGNPVDGLRVIEFDPEEGWYKVKKQDAEGRYEEVDGEPVRLRLYGTITRIEDQATVGDIFGGNGGSYTRAGNSSEEEIIEPEEEEEEEDNQETDVTTLLPPRT